jgi:hypothetical protein
VIEKDGNRTAIEMAMEHLQETRHVHCGLVEHRCSTTCTIESNSIKIEFNVRSFVSIDWCALIVSDARVSTYLNEIDAAENERILMSKELR